MATVETYVRTDEHGVIRVGNTRVMLDSVLVLFEQGEAPESIQSAYPSLSLEHVYGAIAFILGHPDEVKEYKKRQEQAWADSKARFETKGGLSLETLRARMARATEPK